MSNSNNKKSFVKSNTFITFTALASIFFVIFLASVIMMGVRYNAARVILETKIEEEGQIWLVFLTSQAGLSKPIPLFGDETIILSPTMINDLIKACPNWNMNLAFTIMTIIFVFAFVITGFVPLGYAMIKLGEKRSEKKLLKKQQKEQLLEAKGN